MGFEKTFQRKCFHLVVQTLRRPAEARVIYEGSDCVPELEGSECGG